MKTQEELNQALLEAVLANDIVAFGQALTNGAQVNHRFLEGQTALHLAAYYGRDEMVKWLIAYGADVEAQDTKGDTPLMLAMQEQHTRCSAWLREQVVKLEVERDARYRNAPKPPLPAPIPFHKQYPVGSKIKIQLEVEVLEHDEVFTVKVAPKEGYMLQGGAQVWLKTSVITVIEDQP
jgi:hypothetical protein